MVKLLFLKMARDMRKSLVTYLICILIVAVGFCGYSVLSVTSDQIYRSKDHFFQMTNFGDVFAEVQAAPYEVISQLRSIEGVESVQPRLAETVQVMYDGENIGELKILSLESGGLNLPYLIKGLLPEKGQRQIVVGEGFYTAHGMNTGDSLQLIINGKPTQVTVSGCGITPETIYMLKNVSDMLPETDKYDGAFLEYSAMADIFQKEGTANSFVFRLQAGYTLDDVKAPIEKALENYGCYRVYDHEGETSVSMLQSELDQLAKMTTVVPFLFLIVAAVILYIALKRLIEQQRTQTGTLMAMGISDRQIRFHYVTYGMTVGLVGGLLGNLLGYAAASPMLNYYLTYFRLPSVPFEISLSYLWMGTLVSGVFCGIVSYRSASSAVGLMPAEALRPAPPQNADTKVARQAGRLSWLMTVPGLLGLRSVFSNPKRSTLAVLGIAFAYMITTVLVSMNIMFDLFIFDSLNKNQQQDIIVHFSQPVAKEQVLATVRSAGIQKIEGISELSVTLRGRQGELDCMVQGMEKESELYLIYDERGEKIQVADIGIVISRHMADLLNVRIGDSVEVEVSYPKKRISSLPVTGIAAQYIGTTAYMSLESVGKISEYRNVYTSVLLKAPLDVQHELTEKLEDSNIFAGVESRQQRLDNYSTMMGSVELIMGAMAALGVLIGIAVIYTSSLISFEELKREVSTMMLLGLSSRQCLEVVSVGQWILAAAAVVLGLPMTIGVSKLMSASMASDLYSIPDFVSVTSLFQGMLLLFVAVWISTKAIHRKLKKITPIELLRERD